MLTKEEAQRIALDMAIRCYHRFAAIYLLNDGWYFGSYVDEYRLDVYLSTFASVIEYCELLGGEQQTEWGKYERKGVAA